jgi:hypothetical protein
LDHDQRDAGQHLHPSGPETFELVDAEVGTLRLRTIRRVDAHSTVLISSLYRWHLGESFQTSTGSLRD